MARTQCQFCLTFIDHEGTNTYQYVTGWARNRKQGGTNALALRQTLSKYACSDCIDKHTSGLQNQQPMFDFD